MNIKNSLKVSNSALPLYSRVESIIRNKIMNGQLMPGELLPKEQDLAEQFNVSQITIRTALSHLKEEGLIVRSRAKGTFVADTIPEKQQYFLDMDDVYHLVRDASKYEVKIAGFEKITVREARYPRDLTSFFACELDDSITVLKRVRSIKKQPVVLLENHLPTEIAKHLTQKEILKKSVLKILKDKIDLPVGRGEFYVEAIPAEPDIAEILKAELFEPIISVKVYYWFKDDKPFEIVNCFTRAEYFKYKGSISASQFKDV